MIPVHSELKHLAIVTDIIMYTNTIQRNAKPIISRSQMKHLHQSFTTQVRTNFLTCTQNEFELCKFDRLLGAQFHVCLYSMNPKKPALYRPPIGLPEKQSFITYGLFPEGFGIEAWLANARAFTASSMSLN